MPEKIMKKVSGKVAEKKTEKLTKPKSTKTAAVKSKPKKSLTTKSKTVKTVTKKVVKKEIDLKASIIHGMKEKNGDDIVVIDFKKINNSLCDYFIICHGSSNRQVEAIAEGVEESVRKQLGIKPYHREGFENAQWILLDYLDIIVHIFEKETREFYKIEELWGDAETTKIS